MAVVNDMGSNGDDAVAAAIGWHLRLPDASRDEWQAFIAWLEARPEHAAAYDRVTLDDDLLAPSLLEMPVRPAPGPAVGPAANDEWPTPQRRWRAALWAVPALAAALALAIALPRTAASDPLTIRTDAGARKLIAFADGSRITVNGGSRMLLQPGNARFAALESGEATFEIKHDAAHPFVVKSGALTLNDLGTVFNVVRDGQRLGVAVSEGAVMFEPDRQALTIRPGVALAVDEQARKVVFSRVAPEDVGAWRHGRLAFGADRLADVAAAIARATGVKVAVAPSLADTRFTGSFRMDRDQRATVNRLAMLSGNRALRDGEGWIIVPAGHALP